MGRGTSDRQVSKKYICYLHEWDRRLKKTVNTPRENSLGHREYDALHLAGHCNRSSSQCSSQCSKG